jgi:hypothetical protein
MRRVIDARRLGAALLSIVVVVLLDGCRAPARDASEAEAAMIARAQADSAQEAQFQTDSIALAATFRAETVARTFTMPQRLRLAEGDEGEPRDTTVTVYVAQSRTGRFCNNMAPSLWTTRAAGDTLTCQWSDRVEGIAQSQ